jgi:hypothetical protein
MFIKVTFLRLAIENPITGNGEKATILEKLKGCGFSLEK